MKKAVKAVEKDYLKLDAPLLDNISKLVQGVKPVEEKELKDVENYLSPDEKEKVTEHMKARKIPDYWFKVLSNSGIVKNTMGPEDEPLLKAIENIHVVDEEGTDNFTIVFSMG